MATMTMIDVFFRTFFMILLMELGSGSNFTIAALASNSSKPILVWVAGSLALVFTSFLAMKLGGLLTKSPVNPNTISGVVMVTMGMFFLFKQ